MVIEQGAVLDFSPPEQSGAESAIGRGNEEECDQQDHVAQELVASDAPTTTKAGKKKECRKQKESSENANHEESRTPRGLASDEVIPLNDENGTATVRDSVVRAGLTIANTFPSMKQRSLKSLKKRCAT